MMRRCFECRTEFEVPDGSQISVFTSAEGRRGPAAHCVITADNKMVHMCSKGVPG